MSRFTVCEPGESANVLPREYFWFELHRSDWDDYDYRTTFRLVRHGLDAKTVEVGYVKIMRAGMGVGAVDIPREFDVLPADFASLGQTLDYYRTVRKLGSEERTDLLEGLRDIATGYSIVEGLGESDAFKRSLLRSSEAQAVLRDGRAIVSEGEIDRRNTHPTGTLRITLPRAKHSHTVDLNFHPKGALPHRVNVWIGRNGTGKTQALAHLAITITDRSDEEAGQWFGDPPEFTRVIAISFSPFDAFSRPRNPKLAAYTYVGLRPLEDSRDGEEQPVSLKDAALLHADMLLALRSLVASGYRSTLERLLVGVIPNRQIGAFAQAGAPSKSIYGTFSAGQRIVVSSLVSALAYLEPKSLLLFDEPEIHLHPALLSHLMYALHEVLTERDSYAVIATHSPLVLQQVPSRFVRVFRRLDDIPLVQGLQRESFGASGEEIASAVFHLDEPTRDYRTVLDDLLQRATADEIERMFDERLPLRAAAYLRSRTRGGGNE